MKRVIKWATDHIVLCFVVSSIIFAVLVHLIFSHPAPRECLRAKWEAGDILTYVSTVSLGLLAVWQNKRFKEENDKSQERIESLTVKANEISAISKIIEHESSRISQLKIKAQNFMEACSTENILADLSDIGAQPDGFKNIYLHAKMDIRRKQIRVCVVELLSEFRTYRDSAELIKLIDLVSKYGHSADAFAKSYREKSSIDSLAEEKRKVEKDCITSIFDFISGREKLLNEVIYGELSLDQIKAMYRQGIQKEAQN